MTKTCQGCYCGVGRDALNTTFRLLQYVPINWVFRKLVVAHLPVQELCLVSKGTPTPYVRFQCTLKDLIITSPNRIVAETEMGDNKA